MTIIEKMQVRYETMTEGEKKIYLYIMENTTLFSLQSIQDVAEKLETSKTSLVRFAKMLGFDGYSQFKKNLQEEEILCSTPAQRLEKLQKTNYVHSVQSMKDKEISVLQDIHKNTDKNDIEKLLLWINQSQQIYVAGWKEGYFLAEILEFRLRAIGYKMHLLSRSVLDFNEQLMYGEEGDIFIGFDFFKYSRAMLQAFQEAGRKSMRTVCITDSPICPCISNSEIKLFCPSKTDYLLNSMNGPLFLVNWIVSEVYSRTDRQLMFMLDQREHLRNLSDEYEGGENK